MRKSYYFLIFTIGCISEKEKQVFQYSPFSESVVHLTFANNPVDTLFIEASAVTNIPLGYNASKTLSVVKAGEYYVDFEIDRPTKSLLKIGDDQYNIFVFPEDTTHINISTFKGGLELSFSGNGKDISKYYLDKKKNLGYTDIRYPLNKSLSSKSTYKLLKQSADSVVNRELLFLEKYTSSNQLPEWFLAYEHAEIVYSGAGYKTGMPKANEMMKYFKDTLSNDYYDFLNQIEVDNSKAILSSHYFWFLDEYFARNLSGSEINQLVGLSRMNKYISHKLNQSKDQLSGDVKETYHKYNFSSMIKFYADSMAIDSLAKVFEISDYKELVRIAGIRSRDEMEMLNIHNGDTIPEFFLADGLDSLISIRSFQHKILYLNFWATWCGPCIQNMPELNKLIAHYENNSHVNFLNICVDCERDKWLTSIAKYKLKGVNLIAEGNWNSKLRSYFNIKGIPHYTIINKGNILFENLTDKAPIVQGKLDSLLTPHYSKL